MSTVSMVLGFLSVGAGGCSFWRRLGRLPECACRDGVNPPLQARKRISMQLSNRFRPRCRKRSDDLVSAISDLSLQQGLRELAEAQALEHERERKPLRALASVPALERDSDASRVTRQSNPSAPPFATRPGNACISSVSMAAAPPISSGWARIASATRRPPSSRSRRVKAPAMRSRSRPKVGTPQPSTTSGIVAGASSVASASTARISCWSGCSAPR